VQDLLSANLGYIRNVEAQACAKRAEWAAWNPQRSAAKELAAAVASGVLTLEECERRWKQSMVECSPAAGHSSGAHHDNGRAVSMATATGIGAEWSSCLHPKPFLWPAPKTQEVRVGIVYLPVAPYWSLHHQVNKAAGCHLTAA
jgi:hypothetical protein